MELVKLDHYLLVGAGHVHHGDVVPILVELQGLTTHQVGGRRRHLSPRWDLFFLQHTQPPSSGTEYDERI